MLILALILYIIGFCIAMFLFALMDGLKAQGQFDIHRFQVALCMSAIWPAFLPFGLFYFLPMKIGQKIKQNKTDS